MIWKASHVFSEILGGKYIPENSSLSVANVAVFFGGTSLASATIQSGGLIAIRFGQCRRGKVYYIQSFHLYILSHNSSDETPCLLFHRTGYWTDTMSEPGNSDGTLHVHFILSRRLRRTGFPWDLQPGGDKMIHLQNEQFIPSDTWVWHIISGRQMGH